MLSRATSSHHRFSTYTPTNSVARRSFSAKFDKEFRPETTRIGFIGIEVMGWTKCTVYNRTPQKAQPLLDIGAKWANNPLQVAQNSDVVFTMLGYPSDVQQVILGTGKEDGVIHGLQQSNKGVVVDMTTSEPSLAVKIAEEGAKRNIGCIDAPVSGGDVGAREARLSIMIGGDVGLVEALRPLFEAMGKNIRHMGPSGAGQSTKMGNQILISTTMIGVVEALLYAYKSGLDLNEFIAAVGSGAAGSWSLNFDPGFYVDHFVKDMGIALAEAEKMKLNLPGLKLAHSLYKELQAQGHGKKGTHSLMLALEKLNNIHIQK